MTNVIDARTAFKKKLADRKAQEVIGTFEVYVGQGVETGVYSAYPFKRLSLAQRVRDCAKRKGYMSFIIQRA